jgi:hypothetical protein
MSVCLDAPEKDEENTKKLAILPPNNRLYSPRKIPSEVFIEKDISKEMSSPSFSKVIQTNSIEISPNSKSYFNLFQKSKKFITEQEKILKEKKKIEEEKQKMLEIERGLFYFYLFYIFVFRKRIEKIKGKN